MKLYYLIFLFFQINDIERGYYADGEDAYDMRCTFAQKKEDDKKKDDDDVDNVSKAVEEISVA